MRGEVALLAFNRGLLSRLALARNDLRRTALSAEIQTNWMPRALGSMMLRPGLQYITGVQGNAAERCIPFVYGLTDTAIVECTDSTMRVLLDDAPITRASVATAITNGTFDSNLTGWTDADETGATSAWATGGYMSLIGTRFTAAIQRQNPTVAVADRNIEHALRIVVTRGPVTLRVGTSSGAQDLISETTLGTGTHSLAFTPTGSSFWVDLKNWNQAASLVDSCTIEAAGTMQIPTTWDAADLPNLRWDQSADVVYVACSGQQQRKIERHGTRSWSFVTYETSDGPFRVENLGPITISSSGLTGDVTLTASAALWSSTHVGALFSFASVGQEVDATLSAGATFSDPIKVTGVGSSRDLGLHAEGVWAGTVTLQRSISAPGSWSDVSTYTADPSSVYNDTLDNQIVYYRMGFKALGDYTSGTATIRLVQHSGSITGIARITGYTSETSVSAAVLSDLGSTTATNVWSEGAWSDFRGWPSAAQLYEGRLWWLGKDRYWGSVSDAFSSFDATTEGDSGPISRSIGLGPVDTIQWALGLQRLLAGGQMAELSARSTTFDEPLTPTNFNLKAASTQGSAAVAAVKIDQRGIFVQRSGRRVYQLEFDPASNDYASLDLTEIIPDIGVESSFVMLAVQRKPDTRIHAIRADGVACVCVYDPVEKLLCWVKVETSGFVEDVVVLPATIEDAVYYVVRRTINGATVRYLEKWAREDECTGGATNKQADAFKIVTGPVSTITGADHLEGETVVAWADGKDIGTFTVTGGSFALGATYNSVVYGLAYTAQFKSAKLGLAAQIGTPLTHRKRVEELGFILADTHYQGLRFGPDFVNMDDLPQVESGAVTAADTVWEAFDRDMIEFPGGWDPDVRVCLEATAPRPCTVLAAVVGFEQ